MSEYIKQYRSDDGEIFEAKYKEHEHYTLLAGGCYLFSIYIQSCKDNNLKSKNKNHWGKKKKKKGRGKQPTPRTIYETPHWKSCWVGQFKDGKRISGKTGPDSWKYTHANNQIQYSDSFGKHCVSLSKHCNIFYCPYCATAWKNTTDMLKCCEKCRNAKNTK
eukprot:463801_1